MPRWVGFRRATLALTLLALRKGEEALAEGLREPEEVFRLLVVAIIHHVARRRTESDAALRELIAKHRMEAAYQVAQVHGARGGESRLRVARAGLRSARSRTQRDKGPAVIQIPARRPGVGRVPTQDGIPGIRWEPVLRVADEAASFTIDPL